MLLYLISNKGILNSEISGELFLDHVMMGIEIPSLVIVMDTHFNIVGAIGFLVVFKHLGANGCHNSFRIATQKISVTYL